MDRDKRLRVFKKTLQHSKFIGPNCKFAQGTGNSNSPTVVELGLELIDADLRNVDNPDGYLFWGTIGVLPRHEVYIAAYITNPESVEAISQRLAQMLEIGAKPEEEQGPIKYGQFNNNVAILVARKDGLLYFRNKERWVHEADDSILEHFGPGVPVDRVEVAIYPPDRVAAQGLTIRTFIASLKELFRVDDIHEVRPWEPESTENQHPAPVLTSISLETLKNDIRSRGGFYSDRQIESFHVALNFSPTKHFVILAGLSGTGKTSLVEHYATSVYKAKSAEEISDFFYVCPVRPEWTDPTGLLGYHDVIIDRYVVPDFLEALLFATKNDKYPVFVCLDEMNLARVEYYLADILSSMETGRSISLHRNPLSYEGTNGTPIPKSIPFPKNLYLIGTINTDETTQSISDKVLDRANFIDMSEVNTADYLSKLSEDDGALSEVIEMYGELIAQINNILLPVQLGFGYRTVKEIMGYLAFAKQAGIAELSSVIDQQVRQKILVKLRGGERHRQALADLSSLLTGYSGSHRVLQRMQEDLEDAGSFQY